MTVRKLITQWPSIARRPDQHTGNSMPYSLRLVSGSQLTSQTRFIYTKTRGGGGLPYKSDGGDRRKFGREPLKGTRILFSGRGPNNFFPLTGTKPVD